MDETPPAVMIKIDVDAGFNLNQESVGIGIVARYDNGAFIFDKTGWLSPDLQALEGETNGLLWVFQRAHELH